MATKNKPSRKKQPTKKAPTKKAGDIMLCKWQGRFGNRMHQYAYASTYANKFNLNLFLPSEWEGDKLFKGCGHKQIADDDLRLKVNQTLPEFDNDDFRKTAVEEYSKKTKKEMTFFNPYNKKETYFGKKNVWFTDISCYQEEIFKGMSMRFLSKIFEFKDEIKNLDIYKRLEDRQGTYDIAHLRRDDISNPTYETNFGYSVVSKNSYEKAFKKFGYDPNKIEWTTDDWSGNWGVGSPEENDWFTRRGGWQYPVGSEYMQDIGFDWLPDFLRIYFARSVFRANSSFSFWACQLGKVKKVFAPVLHKRNVYSGRKGSGLETDFEYTDSNNPHWLMTTEEECSKIIIPK